MPVPEGRERTGSLSNEADDPSLARGGAGSETAANADIATRRRGDADQPQGDLEERRETQQVLRPQSDGMGEGLPKDQS